MPKWDQPDDDETPGEKTEGVRIIGAEEAAEALERGDVASRRGEGELRYGDRPAAPPDDVRPAVRFPLPAEEADALTRPRLAPTPPPLPHWTDPPTGEVPRIVPEGSDDSDDFDAWSNFAGGPRWRGDDAADWEEADFDVDEMAHDDSTRIGALAADDADDDLFAWAGREPEAPEAAAPAPRQAAPPRPRRTAPTGGGGRDMQAAVATGVGLVVLALILFKIGPGAAMILVTAVIVLTAAELFGALQRGGYQPATLLGLVASAGLVLGSYWKGETAIPLVFALTVVFSLLWYLAGVVRTNPLMNAGVTVLAVGQVGLLGSFAALILTFPNEHGLGVLIGVILAVVANDVGALVVGQQVGRAPVAPSVSPNKTIEGLLGGAVASIAVSVLVLGMIGIAPWEVGDALALGIVVSIMAPLGDLCESMIKRDLGIKDMGSVLPGHGGFLDRFDGLLFCLPATYYLCRLLDIV